MLLVIIAAELKITKSGNTYLSIYVHVHLYTYCARIQSYNCKMHELQTATSKLLH